MLITLISFTSTEISVSKPRSTCKEVSNSSVIPIFAYIQQNKFTFRNCQHILDDTQEYQFIKFTSHLGDSGMKNRAGINIVQGKIPAREQGHRGQQM